MCQRLVHRGPDDEGIHAEGAFGLGFRRLSIIDVAGGHQPLSNEDGQVTVAFNGEIYNYRELRQGLLERGHHFATASDTEVLVHLYEEVGERVPEYLNGMFAFAIVDRKNERLFLARDRAGKKPLYYSTAVPGFELCFASELKALMAMPGYPDAVNPHSVADFLALSYVPEWATIHSGAQKLPAAHSLTLERGEVKLRRYWQADFHERSHNETAALEELGGLVEDSVRRRMLSDVPLGAFLSGGVDSGAAVGVMSKFSSLPVRTFSMGFTSRSFDELEYARMTAQMHATEHHEEVATPSVESVLSDLMQQFDEPFGDSSAIPTLSLSKMTRSFVTVALSGDGADEVFGGYRRYRFGVAEQRLRDRFPRGMRSVVFGAAGRFYPKFDYLPRVFRAKATLTNIALEAGDAYFNSMSTFRDDGLDAVLSPEMRRANSGYSPRERFRDLFEDVKDLSPLGQMQAVDFKTYLPGDILVKADRATMAHSLEARSPWLDYQLIELAGTLPANWKVRDGVGKHFFKKAISKYVPEAVLNRTKMGFSVPLAEWFRSSLRAPFEALVMDTEMKEYLSLDEVRRIWQEHQTGLHNHDRKLWNMLMLAGWRLRHQMGREISSAMVDA